MEAEKPAVKRKSTRVIPTLHTGIFALHSILEGGFPKRSTTLVKEGADTGKTLLEGA